MSRDRQLAATRARIVDAAVQVLLKGDPSWSMQDVADVAGMSVRTLYRHFPTRDDLVDGVFTWIDHVITGDRPAPTLESVDDLVDAAPAAFGFITEHEALYRILLSSELGNVAHRRSRGRRDEEIRGALSEQLADLDAQQQLRLVAVVNLLASSRAALFLGDYWGFDAEESAHVVGWAIRALAAAAVDPEGRNAL